MARRQERKSADHRHADACIGQQDRAVGSGSRQAEVLRGFGNQSTRQRTQGGRERADEVVPSEHVRSPLVADDVRKGRLLDGQERPDLVAAGTDDADRGGDRAAAGNCRSRRRRSRPAPSGRHPTINVRRRPSRSAVVVSQREITVSPASVSESSSPTSHSFRPTSTRYSTSTTESRP